LTQKSGKVKKVESAEVGLIIFSHFFRFFTKIKNRACSNKCGLGYTFSDCELRLRRKFGKATLPAIALDHLYVPLFIQKLIAVFFPEIAKKFLKKINAPG